ncbi:MAG: nucleotidyl transferase AbiEii/AbiGii toxin family protein [Actinobacteria bacterium]|nr:nucleotidyl transferase AbiEii/AbiGii toxin family protein [Actinomycetota bacterium]
MTEPSLPEKIVSVDAALAEHKIAHAFGGALALAYYAEPRATIDIDLNVFLPTEDFERIAEAFRPLGVDITVDREKVDRDGQCRLRWGRTPIDVFLAYDQIHADMRQSLHRVPFSNTTIPILSPEHLIVCKAVFDRPKDWIDIEQMLLVTADLDRTEVQTQMERLVGAVDERFKRLSALFLEALG